MNQTSVTKAINISADRAWNNLSSFRNIEAISPIAKSETTGEGEGAKRTCYMPDGAAIHEILTKVDQQNKEMQYIITSGPFPVTDYVSNIKVNPKNDSSCEITWDCTFNAEEPAASEMKNVFSGFYTTIIDELEKHLS